MNTTLYYVHDPMCSWCWGFRPVWDQLKAALSESVTVINVLGGLAADSNLPMSNDMRQAIQGHWKEIQKQLSTEFNFDFWTNNHPRRSTYPACRAVIAAKKQACEEAMIDAIQRAYYLRALNPSDIEILLRLAWELFSKELDMDLDQFSMDLGSAATEQELQRQIALTKALPVQGFPSLVLEVDGEQRMLEHNYQDYHSTLKTINDIVN